MLTAIGVIGSTAFAALALGNPRAQTASPPTSASASPSANPSARAVSDYDVPPKAAKITKPVYPREPFSRGIEGTVLIEFVIDEKGDVRNPEVTESVPGLDQAALDCVKQWHFTPARKGGVPVATVASAPVTFRITGKKKS